MIINKHCLSANSFMISTYSCDSCLQNTPIPIINNTFHISFTPSIIIIFSTILVSIIGMCKSLYSFAADCVVHLPKCSRVFGTYSGSNSMDFNVLRIFSNSRIFSRNKGSTRSAIIFFSLSSSFFNPSSISFSICRILSNNSLL